MIAMSLCKIVTGLPDEGLEIQKVTIGQGEEQFELIWRYAGLVISSSKEHCEKGMMLVKRICSENDIARKTEEFYKNAKKLFQNQEKLREELRLKIVGSIKAGGIIKGKCDICK